MASPSDRDLSDQDARIKQATRHEIQVREADQTTTRWRRLRLRVARCDRTLGLGRDAKAMPAGVVVRKVDDGSVREQAVVPELKHWSDE